MGTSPAKFSRRLGNLPPGKRLSTGKVLLRLTPRQQKVLDRIDRWENSALRGSMMLCNCGKCVAAAKKNRRPKKSPSITL